jgi:2-polyprenyl-3-methyl-5-hydroxy-6-metoxy-1,4-benzoquinol methylase
VTDKTIKFGGPEIRDTAAQIARRDLANSFRDFNAEAAALPHFNFDLLMHAYFLDTFAPHMDGVSALELGCFEGNFTALLCERFPDVTVVDASLWCLLAAQKRVGINALFIPGTFETVKLEEKYDAIFAIHVLEHVDDPVTVLRRCREWLAPDGRLFLAVPNAYAASRQIACGMGLVPYPMAVTPAEAEHGHRRTYIVELLRDHARVAGLQILRSGGIMFKPLANFQIDKAMQFGVIDREYLNACYKLGREYPELCASVYAVCGR